MKNNLQTVIYLNKKEGMTPLEALEAFRAKNKEYKDISLTYAGRLDPLASGLLLILGEESIKEKDKYLAKDKEYEFQILFGFATDTYDILGKVLHTDKIEHSHILKNVRMSDGGILQVLEKEIKKNLKYFKGKFVQEYPIYSSKTVGGKALFEYGRAGEQVTLPKREVHVKKLQFISLKKISSKKLLQDIEKRVGRVGGDFRQKEIIKIWQKELSKKEGHFYIGDFVVKCSSGTYVRSIANALGCKIGLPTLAYSIKRTKIGIKNLFEL